MDMKRFRPGVSVSSTETWTPVDATGGVESTVTVGGITYKIHMFTSIGTDYLKINDSGSDGQIEFLCVAGGGGGGMDMGGGGGGGGVLSGRYTVSAGQSITCTVGAGGMGAPGAQQYRSDGTGPQPSGHQYTIAATSGANSVFGPYTAIGGGFGGSSYRGYTPGIAGGNGGSGGGASGYNDNAGTFSGGTGTSGQGFRGGNSTAAYYSGGGGGAGGPGVDSTAQPNGGQGLLVNILGYDLYWGGGGGGASYSLSNGGNGGLGGGGGGALGTALGGAGYNNGENGLGGSPNSWANTRGGNAGANTGGGGGGGSHYNANNNGGEGGSGIVVARYPISRSYPTPMYIEDGIVLALDATAIESAPGSGTTWYDLSPSKMHATGTSAITGGVISANQPYTTANNYLLNNDTHTIGFTFRLSGTGTGTWDKVFGYTPTGTDRSPGIWRFPSNTYLHWRYDPGNTGINIGATGTSGDTTPAAEFSLNTWYYICVTKNGTTATVYINGNASITSASVVATKTSGYSTIQIFPGYTVNTATIKHFHIYNRVLSAAEILKNYQSISPKLV